MEQWKCIQSRQTKLQVDNTHILTLPPIISSKFVLIVRRLLQHPPQQSPPRHPRHPQHRGHWGHAPEQQGHLPPGAGAGAGSGAGAAIAESQVQKHQNVIHPVKCDREKQWHVNYPCYTTTTHHITNQFISVNYRNSVILTSANRRCFSKYLSTHVSFMSCDQVQSINIEWDETNLDSDIRMTRPVQPWWAEMRRPIRRTISHNGIVTYSEELHSVDLLKKWVLDSRLCDVWLARLLTAHTTPLYL